MTFYNQITTILILILWISFGITGMFILRFKNWARKLFIFLAISSLILNSWVIFQEFSNFRKGWKGRGDIIVDVLISLIFYILPSLGAIYFFSLPKIKTQFNPRTVKVESKIGIKEEQ
jgi:membrane protease YdiL (CAAX protease family)